jgi:hypothetical protein
VTVYINKKKKIEAPTDINKEILLNFAILNPTQIRRVLSGIPIINTTKMKPSHA